MDPEELALLNDPALAPFLDTKAGQAFLAGQQAASPAASQYNDLFSVFAPAESAFTGGYGESGGPEGAAMANVVAGAGLAANKDYVVHQETGRVLYKNGVIYDPETDSVTPPAGKAVTGSTAWRAKVLKWDDDKVNDWRDTLNNLGYNVGDKGAVDQEFVAALTQYHMDRYRNYGQVVPVVSQAERAKQTYDPVLRRQRVRGAFAEMSGDDPTEREMQPFLRVMAEELRDALRSGKTPEQAQLRADEAGAEALESDPTLSYIQGAEEEEEDGREFFTSVLQALQGLA